MPDHPRRRALARALVALVPAAAIAATGLAAPRARPALPPYRFAFPRDHASHPQFLTEWWYTTGQLAAGERRFGFELTFFRVGIEDSSRRSRLGGADHALVAHLAITDAGAGAFRYAQAAAPFMPGYAGADTSRFHVWIGPWSARQLDDGPGFRLAAATEDMGLALDLVPLKPAAVHGRDGVSQKSSGLGRASHYYSLARLEARGRLRVGRDSLEVTGQAWMDHEFGSRALAPGIVGWDWFGLQLDDGRELMLYVLRLANGRIEPMSSGTLVGRDGGTRHLPLAAFEVEATATWASPASPARYPSRWIIRVPDEQLELEVEPLLAGQELVFERPLGVTYWEGAVRAVGTARAQPVAGRGYVELTGYAGRVPGF